MTPAERVRRRIFELLEEKGWTQVEWAQSINKTQEWVSQLKTGKFQLRLEDLDQIALSLGTNAVELVRDPDLFQFCADLTPSELAVVRQLRKLSPAVRDAIQVLLAACDTRRRPEEQRDAVQAQSVDKLVGDIRKILTTLQAPRRRAPRTRRAVSEARSGDSGGSGTVP